MGISPEEWDDGKIDINSRMKAVIRKFFRDEVRAFTAEEMYADLEDGLSDSVYDGRPLPDSVRDDFQRALDESVNDGDTERKQIVQEDGSKRMYYKRKFSLAVGSMP